MPQQTLYIQAGRFRRRKVVFADLPELRPTHSRIRETLFNWLQPAIKGACCCDLFAGSGILGFEALSRGAQHATFVEKNPTAIAMIRKNTWAIETGSVSIQQAHIPADTLQLPRPRYDIIFLDPPYQANLLIPTLAWIQHNDILSPKGQIYLEYSVKKPLNLPASWEYIQQKQTRTLIYGLIAQSGTPKSSMPHSLSD